MQSRRLVAVTGSNDEDDDEEELASPLLVLSVELEFR